MPTDINDATFLKEHYEISSFQGGQARLKDQGGASPRHGFHSRLYMARGFGVYRLERLVQQQHRGVF